MFDLATNILQAANVLVCEDDSIKLADFGLARTIQEGSHHFTVEAGSYRWMAPEIMLHLPYDTKVC